MRFIYLLKYYQGYRFMGAMNQAKKYSAFNAYICGIWYVRAF